MRISSTIFLIFFVCAIHATAFSQADGKWFRVQTDNGEFSIEIPESYSYCFDPDGFSVSEGSADYRVRDVNILNALTDGTLVSVEVYKAPSSALDRLARSTVPRDFGLKKIELNGIPGKEILKSTDEYYLVSRYFRSNGRIYVVSALARTPDTPAMNRFFKSLRFNPDSKTASPDATKISTLAVTPIDIKTKNVVTPGNSGSSNPRPPAEPGYKSLVLASRPRAHYVDAARGQNVQGGIMLRLEFGKDGYIPSIEVLTNLPQGLFRQALFAALRIKFLPAEKDGKPISVKRVLEYTFKIY